jgi:hypothetical protein
LVETVATKDSVLKFSAVGTAIVPLKDAESAHLVVEPVTLETGAVRPPVNAVTLLYAILKVPLIITAFGPYLDAKVNLFRLLRI